MTDNPITFQPNAKTESEALAWARGFYGMEDDELVVNQDGTEVAPAETPDEHEAQARGRRCACIPCGRVLLCSAHGENVVDCKVCVRFTCASCELEPESDA